MAEETVYVNYVDADGDAVPCYRCDSYAPTTPVPGEHLSDRQAEEHRGKLFPICKFCYETELGTVLAYPRQYSDTVPTRGLINALNLIYWDGKAVPEVRQTKGKR